MTISTTYADFVRAMTAEVSPSELTDAYLRWNYSTIFTHFLAQTSSDGTNAVDLLRTAARLVAGTEENPGDETILNNLDAFITVVRLVRQEGWQMARPEESTGFSEAARHFAENISVVRAMEERFDEELRAFHDALNERLKRLIPDDLCHKLTRRKDGKPLISWWLGEPEMWDKGVGLVYLDGADVLVAADNRLLVLVYGGSSPDAKARIRQIKDSRDLHDFNFGGEPNMAMHFSGYLTLPEDDPVGFAADRLAVLLAAIRSAEDGE